MDHIPRYRAVPDRVMADKGGIQCGKENNFPLIMFCYMYFSYAMSSHTSAGPYYHIDYVSGCAWRDTGAARRGTAW